MSDAYLTQAVFATDRPVPFLDDIPIGQGVALSSRVRYARNLHGIPFPVAATVEQRDAAQQLIHDALAAANALGDGFRSYRMVGLPESERALLTERWQISGDLASRGDGVGLEQAADELSGVMINEEDHLRIQVFRPGFQLEDALNALNDIDDALGREVEYGFSPRWGYLSSCPTNVGTALRASVMLHLPGLTLSGNMPRIFQALKKLQLTVRGIGGEGTPNLGNLYQVSNQSTLGECETGIVERLSPVISTLIIKEIEQRDELLRTRRAEMLDMVGRAFGALRYGFRHDLDSVLQALSLLRFGVDCSMFRELGATTLNTLLIQMFPMHLARALGRPVAPNEINEARAELLRARLAGV